MLSVAPGFAFQDILQNLLAGILLLFRQPFRGGDQIELGDAAPTVEEINIRETVIVTYDGRRVLIPNAKVYSGIITVQTARPSTRSHFVVGIAYESDIHEARDVALELATSTIDLEGLFWCDPHQLEMRRVRSRSVQAVKGGLRCSRHRDADGDHGASSHCEPRHRPKGRSGFAGWSPCSGRGASPVNDEPVAGSLT